MSTNLAAWNPSFERMGFVADRQACIDAVQMWLLGESEASVVAVLRTTKERWERWKREESFGYLVRALDSGEIGWVRGAYTRMTASLLAQLQGEIERGELSPKVKVSLLSKLVDRQIAMEKRAGEVEEASEEVKELWARLKVMGKQMRKEIQGQVIDVEPSA